MGMSQGPAQQVLVSTLDIRGSHACEATNVLKFTWNPQATDGCPECSAEVLSSVPKCRKAAVHLAEKRRVGEKRRSCLGYRADGPQFKARGLMLYGAACSESHVNGALRVPPPSLTAALSRFRHAVADSLWLILRRGLLAGFVGVHLSWWTFVLLGGRFVDRCPGGSMSIRWPGCVVGSRVWILVAMFQLAMDLPACESLIAGPELRLLQRPPHRSPHPWGLQSGQPARSPAPPWSPRAPHGEGVPGQAPPPRAQGAHRPRDQAGPPRPPAPASSPLAPAPTDQQGPLRRGRRQLQGRRLHAFDFRGSRPTTETEFIAWGPTGEEEGLEAHTFPGLYGPTTVSVLQTRKTTQAAASSTATRATTAPVAPQTKGSTEPLGPRTRLPAGASTAQPSARPSGSEKDIKPPRIPGEASGLAVHQIITITVSLVMVIAALITTLVLKNCCAQSGNARRNSHQRKIHQQEESCQNLTDFTPARVPSSLDIFTAYNETLQCSHECVRASVPVYTDETLLPTGEYKSTFNGNRPSSSDRHLIPVAFVSEKWFEISC
ncbi:adherens junction-associated protein 1 [Dasypus novemcinctus]|uniref:adherens junction-associated protein 1 n=1 Tax=Dasypus novemcinctus TaxID=9361 RepID=UPI00265F7F4B|nr:adherens junction-associated protein 1 [Dasypus novemcinctus]